MEYRFKFSVVIPVYKVEKYLRDTLESLVNQTIGFKENIQVILINDGSPDKSGEICLEYKNAYPKNVIYVEKENGGVSSARNAGLKYIEGKYVNFLDSDDKWELDSFKKAFDFFEEHYDEIDVLSCRVKKFEASETFHVLDYKFDSGNRIADLKDENEYRSIQGHVINTFIKSCALKESDIFDEKIRFGEDSAFINLIILRKLKCGILSDALFYYRKRYDQTSATQIQLTDMDYYTVSVKRYYNALVNYSLELYGEVVPYIQCVLCHDIGWRMRKQVPLEIKENKDVYEAYCNFLKEKLVLIDEKFIITNRVHKGIGVKKAMLFLRDGSDLYNSTYFDEEDEAIYYKDIRLLKLQGKNKICHINSTFIKKEEEKDILYIEGLVAKWILDCCKDSAVSFIIKAGKKKYSVKLKDYTIIKEESFFGESNRYYYFRKKIDLSELISDKSKVKINCCLSFGKNAVPVTVNFGRFVPAANSLSPARRFFGNFMLQCKNSQLTVIESEDLAFSLQKRENDTLERLALKEREDLIKLRKDFYRLKNELSGKKLWLVSDSFYEALGNGEGFFKFMCSKEMKKIREKILPVFVISETVPDYERLKAVGNVIDAHSEEYKLYFLLADKIISSSCDDFAVAPLSEDENAALLDLFKGQVVFIGNEMVAKNRADINGKFIKNISLYCVSRDKQEKAIFKNDYYYYKNEVALTGSPRFDMYESESEKLIAFMPAFFKVETENSFKESAFFKYYSGIINDKKLQLFMLRYGCKAMIYLPKEYKKFADLMPEKMNFKVCRDETPFELIKKASLLVTDYDPGYEFAFLNKPVIYAHYKDAKAYYKNNPDKKGTFNFEKAAFGEIVKNREEFLSAISDMMKNKFSVKAEFKEQRDSFFTFSDRENSKRVFEMINEE